MGHQENAQTSYPSSESSEPTGSRLEETWDMILMPFGAQAGASSDLNALKINYLHTEGSARYIRSYMVVYDKTLLSSPYVNNVASM